MNAPPTRTAVAATPPIAILGVPIDNVSTTEALTLIEGMLASGRRHYFAAANVDFLVQAQQDVELHRILIEADLVTCDGMPLRWASRLLGYPLRERITASDLASPLLALAAQRQLRVFILGATPASAARAADNARQRHPGLEIGHYSPPFGELLDFDRDAIARQIREFGADLLFVSFGCPKQEKWIAMNYRALAIPVSSGIGAVVDFLSGHARRAPAWLQRAGLEWAFRLAHEPRRLFRRYARDFRLLGVQLAREWWHLRVRAGGDEGMPAARLDAGPDCQCLRTPPSLDLASLRGDPLLAPDALDDGRSCILEMSATRRIDVAGIAFLLALRKRLRAGGHDLVLAAPGPSVRRGLCLMRLGEVFPTAADLTAAKSLLQSRQSDDPPGFAWRPIAAGVLAWRGEITAANCDAVWQRYETQMLPIARAAGGLVIDLAELGYIDTAGVSVLLRARERMQQLGVNLALLNPQPAVCNVVRLARREQLFTPAAPVPDRSPMAAAGGSTRSDAPSFR